MGLFYGHNVTKVVMVDIDRNPQCFLENVGTKSYHVTKFVESFTMNSFNLQRFFFFSFLLTTPRIVKHLFPLTRKALANITKMNTRDLLLT